MAQNTDIISIDNQITHLLSPDVIVKYQSLTKEILGRYATYPRKICFIKNQRDLVKKK